MSKQVLTEEERRLIRADIYFADQDEKTDFSDKKIAFFVRYVTGKNVLDLGCVDHSEQNWKSRYWLHKALRTVAKRLVGLDYYAEGVSKLNSVGFNIIVGDAQCFSMSEKFDVITAGDLIEHLPTLEGFFTSIRSCLTEAGRLVVSTPNPWCWKYLAYHMLHKKLTPVNREHVSWFCLQTLENLSGRFGFKIIDHEYSSRRLYERLIPIPSHIKHTTLGVVFEKISDGND